MLECWLLLRTIRDVNKYRMEGRSTVINKRKDRLYMAMIFKDVYVNLGKLLVSFFLSALFIKIFGSITF